ncbi:MAG TPA: SRPBCC family protein [Flavisolibacter sp.]|jgi:ligand-binding SRPBCC domain-containing protein|nr:SRPBCC family protein [Flavisolibacter sp.]
MSTVHRLKSIQKIPADTATTWEFFSNPRNLLNITPPFLNLKVTNEIFGDAAYAGQVITYTVKPLLGIPLFWMTEIVHVDPLRMFVDEQRRGPYKLWHHQHHFKAIEGGTEMTDIVHYQLPMGVLGNLVHAPLVKGKLHDIFRFRFEKVNEVFSPWPGAVMELQID